VFATACRCATLGRVAWGRRAHGPAHGQLKARRRGKAGRTWHVDETSVKVEGRWCYLYRAIDSDGNLVETMLSTTQDMDAAKRFFACALKTVGQPPEKVTTDVYDSYPRSVRETLGPDVHHGASRYMNNRIEQDHRGITQRSYPMRGFGSFDSAARFCPAHDDLRDHLRPRTHVNKPVSLAKQRRLFGGNAGARCARCSRRPSPPRGLSLPAHRRLPHLRVLKPDASRRRRWTPPGQRRELAPVLE